MFRTLCYGILAAMFFSSTFILNRQISLEGGHWFWTAFLRYAYVLTFLIVGLFITNNGKIVKAAFSIYKAHWLYWTITASVGLGIFYSTLCFSASYAPGWVIAATWQLTILITPLVLLGFGRKVPLHGIFFAILIFIGVSLINAEHAAQTSLKMALYGAIPAFISACAYPIGNQLIWEAKKGERFKKFIPHIENPELDNSFCKIIILILGSLPFWLILGLLVSPPPPANTQLFNTALVGISSGIIATALFLLARHRARTSLEITAVDATQGFEAVFTLFGEIIFLHAPIPNALSFVGIGLMLIGIFCYSYFQEQSNH